MKLTQLILCISQLIVVDQGNYKFLDVSCNLGEKDSKLMKLGG